MALPSLSADDPLILRAAGWLRAQGVREGDRVAVVADNSRAVLALTWGALRAGVIPVMINTALTTDQVTAQVDDAEVVLLVADEADLQRLRDVRAPGAPPSDRRVLLGEEVLLTGPPATDLVDVPRARPMHFTSGTSGRAKGVWTGLLPPAQARAWAEDERLANPTGPGDVHLVCSHLFHSGPHRYALNTLNQGGTVVIQPHFDAAATLTAIAAHRVTTAFMVPTHLARLLDHPDADRADLSSLRWIHHAGAACPDPLKRKALDWLPEGVLHEFYGSTEGQFTAIAPAQWLAHPGSVGRARRGRTLRVTDGDGRPVPAGTVGRVWVSAPDFARFTYWRRPEATAAAWDGDHFTVGDLGVLDADGWLTLAGRRTDLIITGGVNVYPAEVERVLMSHPGVREGVVFGIAHPRWGQQVTAAVIPARGASLDAEEVHAFLRERLAGFQTPKQVMVVDEVPRTASGKVLRRELAAALAPREGSHARVSDGGR